MSDVPIVFFMCRSSCFILGWCGFAKVGKKHRNSAAGVLFLVERGGFVPIRLSVVYDNLYFCLVNSYSVMIPKIIHYCWLSNEPFPADVQRCIDSWRQKLPDYELRLWDFSRFDISQSRWVQEAFAARKYAFAADYIRIYALYHFGGIYLDCDVEVLRPYDDLLHLPYFIGQEKTQEVGDVLIEAATMGFEPGHPLLRDILDYYEGRPFRLGRKKFDIRPLPRVMMLNIQKNYMWKRVPSVAAFDYDRAIVSLLPEEYFSPKTWFGNTLELTPNTYSIHHFAGSWIKKERKKDRLKRVWRNFLNKICKS